MNPSQRIPEGANTVTAEGPDLARAIAIAAESIGTEPLRVDFKFDLAHFRSSLGTSVAQKTVKIIAWKSDRSDADIAAAEAKKTERPAPSSSSDDSGEERPRREARSRDRGERSSDRGERSSDRGERSTSERGSRDRGERSSRDRGDREERPRRERRDRDDRGDRGDREERRVKTSPEDATDLEATKASTFAQEWFTTLLGYMDIQGTVKSGGNDERVQLWINADRAGRLIGKRGSTLGAIRHLLGLAVRKQFGELTIDVDVEDTRKREEGGGERREERSGDREDRGDRRERRSRGGRDRGGRDRGDRGGDRDDRRGKSSSSNGGGERSRYPEAKLRALARRAADKALETEKTITINLELNAYDRRIVHMEVSEIDGVNSRSEERDDGGKIIQVYPE